MAGNSRFSYPDEEFDEVVLDDLELLKNDGYAYSQFYEHLLQKFFLKREEAELTDAGEELAAIVDDNIGEDRERIHRCVRQGRAERADFEAFSESFANQSLYLESECEDERRALQKVLLGFVNWQGDKGDGTVELVEQIPADLSLDVLNRLKAAIETGEREEAQASKLYQKYHRGFHHYRSAHSMFLLRSWQLQTDATESRITLSEADRRSFQQYRDLMRVYWLQVYAGYAVEAQLEALCTFLNSRIPARFNYESLLDRATDATRLQRAFTALTTEVQVQRGTDETSAAQRTRDLMLYGSAELTNLTVDISSPQSPPDLTLGEMQSMLEAQLPAPWDETPPVAGSPYLNEVLLAKSIRKSLNHLQNEVDDEAKQFDYWVESMARSIALLLVTVSRFGKIKDDREWFYNYAFNRLDSPYNSLPDLTRFVRQADDETPLSKFAHRLLDERVVQTHLQVFYSRLRPGNVKRGFSFDQDERLCLEADRERGERPYVARASFIRFSELNTFLRDSGLLLDSEDGYEPTDRGLELLSRLNGGKSS